MSAGLHLSRRGGAKRSARSGRARVRVPAARRLAAVVLALPLATSVARADEAETRRVGAWNETVRPILEEYCLSCHRGSRAKANVDLASDETIDAVRRAQRKWRAAARALRDREMPPENKDQPSESQRLLVADWILEALDTIDIDTVAPDPGRTVIRRLTRAEYDNTVRDLLGVDSRPAERFPQDGGGGEGFDNNADTLFVPPLLLEKYLAAARDVLREAEPDRWAPFRPSAELAEREAARRSIASFARRAWRRPIEDEEVERTLRVHEAAIERGHEWLDALRVAQTAVLVSPSFLFRIEPDRGLEGPHEVSDHELATRLSYFLWVSMPDEELFRLADAGELRRPEVLEEQVRRMLAHPRSRAFARDFVEQWLGVRSLRSTTRPDPGRFPEYTDALRDSMLDETTEFFAAILRGEGSLLDLLDCDYAWLNETLARHYGIDGVEGDELRKVRLSDRHRGGLLGMASVLTLTSYSRRTSPVLRGKWILEEVLGTPPPPPPPNAASLSEDDRPRDGLTFRQRLEQHRAKPACSSCHQRMDPLGFGLENFDAIGRWRTDISGEPVDASGELSNGRRFAGPVELKSILLEKKSLFLRCLVEKMLAYALGRGLEHYDAPAVRRILDEVEAGGSTGPVLVAAISRSYPFLFRRDRSSGEMESE